MRVSACQTSNYEAADTYASAGEKTVRAVNANLVTERVRRLEGQEAARAT